MKRRRSRRAEEEAGPPVLLCWSGWYCRLPQVSVQAVFAARSACGRRKSLKAEIFYLARMFCWFIFAGAASWCSCSRSSDLHVFAFLMVYRYLLHTTNLAGTSNVSVDMNLSMTTWRRHGDGMA